jgi:hypothetical protein
MAVPFMSRQSGFNNNNRFGNQRSLTPFQGGLGKVQPTPVGPGMSPGFRNAPSPQMTSAMNAPRVDGREAGVAAMRGYVNPAANGPTKPLRAPNGPGVSQSYGNSGGSRPNAGQGQFVDRSGQLQPRSAVPSMDSTRSSFDANGRPNGSPLPSAPPRQKATFTNPGANGPNPGLGGTKANGFSSNAFRDAQERLSQQKGFDGNGGDKSAEMPGGIPQRAQDILRGQAESSQRNMKKYGTQDPQEASRAMWRERAFRQGMTRRGINSPQQRMAADNYMGRTADPRNPENGGEPFKGASREFARGSVQGQKPYVKPVESGAKKKKKPVENPASASSAGTSAWWEDQD